MATSTTSRATKSSTTAAPSSPKPFVAQATAMRIDLLSPPFRGHLHPTLAIARELATEFDVRVLSTPGTLSAIEASGITARAILTSEDEARCFAIANVDRPVRANVKRMYGQLREAVAIMGRLQDHLRAAYHEDPPDLVIVDFTLAGVGIVAEEFGLPWWTLIRSPSILETPDGPPAYLGGLRPATNFPRRAAYAVLRRLTRLMKRGLFLTQRNALRGMGIKVLYRADGSEALYSPRCILAACVEQLEFPATWPAALTFVGPQLYTPASNCPPPPFVDGRTHVLITCGTHLPWFKERLAHAATGLALALPDVVVHFTDGAPASKRIEWAGNFVRLGYVDYDAHLARYAVVVHHGGSGVLNSCLAQGVPAVIYPLDYDQFDNAARADAAGVARWISTLDELPRAVENVIADRSMKARCVMMQSRVRDVSKERRILDLARQFSNMQRR